MLQVWASLGVVPLSLGRWWAVMALVLAVPLVAFGETEEFKSPEGFSLEVPEGYEVMPVVPGGPPAMILGPGKGTKRPVIQVRVKESSESFSKYASRGEEIVTGDYPGAEFDGSSSASCVNAKGRLYTFNRPGKDSILLGIFDGGGKKYLVIGSAPVLETANFRAAFTQLCSSLAVTKAEAGGGFGEETPKGEPDKVDDDPWSTGTRTGGDAFGPEGDEDEDDGLGNEARGEAGGIVMRGPSGWIYETIEEEARSGLQFQKADRAGLTILVERLWGQGGASSLVAELEQSVRDKTESHKIISSRKMEIDGESWREFIASFSKRTPESTMSFRIYQRLLQKDGSVIRFSVVGSDSAVKGMEKVLAASADSIKAFGPGYRTMRGGVHRFSAPNVAIRLNSWKLKHSSKGKNLKLELRPIGAQGAVDVQMTTVPWVQSLDRYVNIMRLKVESNRSLTIVRDEADAVAGLKAFRFDGKVKNGETLLRLIYKLVAKENKIFILAIVLREKDYVSLQSRIESLYSSFRPTDK